MKKLLYLLVAIGIVASSSSCEQAEKDRKDLPWWVTGQEYTFTPSTSSSVKWFSYRVKEGGVIACNNTGKTWETFKGYKGSNSLAEVKVTIYHDNGGEETITMRDDGTYSYTGTTATGYSESHTGEWSEGSPC